MDLHESVLKFTSAPAGVDPGKLAVTDVVVMAPGTPASQGYERARALLHQGRTVRLVGDGVAFRQGWPEWVHQSRGIVLTEIGAYFAGDVSAITDAVRSGINQWLRSIYAGVLKDYRAELFYGDAFLRFYYQHISLSPPLKNVVLNDGACRYHYVGAEWIGMEALRVWAEMAGGKLEAAPRRVSPWWHLKAAILGVGMLAATMVEQLRRYIGERPSRIRLRQLRRQQKDMPDPSLWVWMTPDWPRMNRHLLESIVEPMLERGSGMGILMQGKLLPGLRHEFNMRKRIGSELWPALGPVHANLDRCTIEQASSAESMGNFLSAAWVTCRASLRALARIAAAPNYVDSGAMHMNLEPLLVPTMKLFTQDLFNAVMAYQATERAVRRHSFSNVMVAISGPLFPAPVLVFNEVLMRAGARTVDFVHGTMGNRLAFRHEVCSVRCVWTHADEETYGDSRPNVIAGMPRAIARNQRAPGFRARKILIVTNYLHRDSLIAGKFPWWPYLDELMRCIPLVGAEYGDRFKFRWRPHPADNDQAIAEVMAQFPDIELSRGVSLAEDAAWSDIIISTGSSAAIEVLFADVPVFLHVRPVLELTPDVRYFSDERRFCWADDFLPRFRNCVALMDAVDPSALDPERTTRVRFFGPTGEPGCIDDWIQDQLHPQPEAEPSPTK